MKPSTRSRKHQPPIPSRTLWSAHALLPAKSASLASRRAHKLIEPKRALQEQPATPVKPSMRFPLATMVAKPVVEWTPFFSCLIDTVAVVIDLRHKALWKIAQNNPNVTRKGSYQLLVHSPFSSKINARVFSREKGTKLMIEASIPKFLTGQNIVGVEDLFEPCKQLIFAVLEQMGVVPTDTERRKLQRGRFKMTRVDYALHCDCGSPERAAALMAALRSLIFAKAKDASAYGIECVYAGQHSSRWTLRVYRKDLEIKKRGRGLPANVYGRQFLLDKVQNCARLELVLRSPELKRLGLNDPLAWNVADARQRMQMWVDRLSTVTGTVPNVECIDELTSTQQLKLRAWLGGDWTAFMDSPTTFATTRKVILEKTGIDIRGEPCVKLQRRAMLCIRAVFQQGIGFKSYEDKWTALCAGLNG
ncbi:phage/plasmid replication protein, II/X family [Flavobacterium sp.]|uniref:phage/plasmid replication protein, II/X family n=1 Tax=Flavobacterium sp. TaxID=239 RepID=UPI0032643AB4